MINVKEPKPKVTLIGQDGNAFFVIGNVIKHLRKSGLYNVDEIKEIQTEMMSGNYDKVLQTAMKYCEVE